MGVTIALLSFFALLFGMVLLILVCGIQWREEEQARAASESQAGSSELTGTSHFMEDLAPVLILPAPPVDDVAFLRRLEMHMLREREAAEDFVREPSVDRLHGHSAPLTLAM